MAKKTGFNLNPGADPTLVAAAYRMGMANVPKDLSGTFEAMATNYANTMEIVGDAWSGVAKDVGTLAVQATDKAIENIKQKDNLFAYSNQTGTTFLIDKLDEIKGGLKQTWGLKKDVEVEMESQEDYEKAMNELGGEGVDDVNLPTYEDWKKEKQQTETKKAWTNPLSRENRAKRINLRQKRDKLFNQVNSLMEGNINLNTQLASGNVNELATGKINMMLANGLQSMNTVSGKSADGTYLMPSHDENDDIIFTLHGPKGIIAGTDSPGNITYADTDAKGITITASQIDNNVRQRRTVSQIKANN